MSRIAPKISRDEALGMSLTFNPAVDAVDDGLLVMAHYGQMRDVVMAVRELHRIDPVRVRYWRRDDLTCACSDTDWPCDTARLVYTADEIARLTT